MSGRMYRTAKPLYMMYKTCETGNGWNGKERRQRRVLMLSLLFTDRFCVHCVWHLSDFRLLNSLPSFVSSLWVDPVG